MDRCNVTNKNEVAILEEWDQLAEIRAKQLYEHKDISMDKVIIPAIEELMKGCNLENVIDLGCGTGYTTNILSKKTRHITGIDISNKSIQEGIKRNPKIKYENFSIEEYAVKNKEKFTLAISNMVFMDVKNLKTSIQGAFDLIKEESHLILSITHPYFWPLYWGYSSQKWFNYSKEIQIEADFEISLESSKFKTTHYHRPLHLYLNTLIETGFEINEVLEPLPEQELIDKYPDKWQYPRFLILKCQKTMANSA